MRTSLRLVVLGMMGRLPFGGQTWLYLNWLRGLTRLGHEVWYVEDDTAWPYDPTENALVENCTYAVRHIAACAERIGLGSRWAFRFREHDVLSSTGEVERHRSDECFGLSGSQLDELYRSCDALLNVGGVTQLREQHLAAPLRIYVQTDPVTMELKLARGSEGARRTFETHQVVSTYGENYGAPDCGVPLNGIRYGKTRQPIDLALWAPSYDPQARYFTTIGNYRQTGSDVEYQGQIYRWSKHFEWEKFLGLPALTRQPIELAMTVGDTKDRERLLAHGWRVVDPFAMSLDVFGAFPAYFRGSRAEFTVAKDQNVRLRSGWFSERAVCYLASGKPVVSQDTGFSNILPTGEGLFGFTTMDEAVAAIDAINSDYARHCKAARAIAEDYFEARAVAARLLADLGLA